MNQSCETDQAGKVPYPIGQWLRFECKPCGEHRPPHVEDVSVTNAKKIGEDKDLSSYLLRNTTPWEGTMDVLFDGNIHFTMNGGGYVSATNIPDRATGFWIPSEPLRLDTDE